MRGIRRCTGLIAAGLMAASVAADACAQVATYEIVGDGIPIPLQGAEGRADRGRAIIVDRQKGLCLLCHSGPFPEQRFMGDLAPSLEGTGSRWNAAQLRLRVVAPERLDPDTIMPAYHRAGSGARVAPAHRGRPILSAQDIEDVVAFLTTLR